MLNMLQIVAGRGATAEQASKQDWQRQGWRCHSLTSSTSRRYVFPPVSGCRYAPVSSHIDRTIYAAPTPPVHASCAHHLRGMYRSTISPSSLIILADEALADG